MMAANAIQKIRAPKTGGVRYPCVFCESRGYSNKEEKAQHELLDLMSETEFLRQENYRRERKLRKLQYFVQKFMDFDLDDTK